MKVKKGDFIELDYVAREKDSGRVFDLTREDVAKKEELFNPKFEYKPIKICVGEGDVLPGLDEALVDQEVGKELHIEIPSEKAFGKKDSRLIQLIGTNKFLKSKIRPVPGLQLNIDGQVGTVKSVSGGRTLIDFNHPLAGRDIVYDATIRKILSTPEEKLQAIIDFHLRQGITTSIKENVAHVNISTDKGLEYHLREKILKLVPNIKDVVFKSDTKQ